MTTSTSVPLCATPVRVVVLGDSLECLGALLADPAILRPDAPGLRNPQAAVIGVDGTAATTWRAFRALVRRQTQACIEVGTLWPALRHIIVIVDAPRELGDDEAMRHCEAAAERTHRWIEQDCGAYIVVTFIVATGCDEPGLLARRVLCRAGQVPATDAHGAVHWREIVQATIQRVNSDSYL